MPSGKTVDKVLRRDAFPIPDNTNPTGTRCIQIEIPDDVQWEQTFFACLTLLTKWNSFQQDGAHLAADIASVWRNVVWNNMTRCDGTPIRIPIEEMGVDMTICEQLRFNPETGKFEGLCCGEWTPIDGQDGITFGGAGQDGPGSHQPPAGECTTYHAQFDAKSQYLVPTVVNTGDVLTFTGADGSAWDGLTLGLWTCPDGQVFFAGDCIGGYTTSGIDPAPAIHHMALVAKIGSIYYQASIGSITVPSGVTNAQVYIQANDSNLTDNSGSFALDIEVCNNQAVEWSHELDLSINAQGFVVVDAFGCSSGSFGAWVPGSGWQPANCLNATTWYRTLQIRRDFGADVIFTNASYRYDVTLGTHVGSTNHLLYIESVDAGGTVTQLNSQTAVNGTNKLISSNGGFTCRKLGLWLGVDSVDTPATPDGSGRVFKLLVSGLGFDPFV